VTAEPVTLTTKRLVLRPHLFEDLDDLLTYAQDDRWSQFMPVPRPYTRADGEQWIARAVLIDWDVEPTWALEFEGRCSGGVSVRPDRTHGTAEFGYSLAPELWGKGLVHEAMVTVLDWAFPHFDLEKAWARTDSENRQSWRVMEKLGMQREGHLRSHRVLRGERHDEVSYGLLREDWERRSAT
jgi:[ribosomal protein S5]-alanine N-acetyltransferase